MSTALNLRVSLDDSAVRAMFARLSQTGADLTKPNRVASLVMREKVTETFRTETDPWGSPWPPLAPATIKDRLRRGNTSTQKLIDMGAMYDSLDNRSDADSATVSMAGPAAIHQEGAVGAGRGHAVTIPPRPMFPTDDTRGPAEDWWNAVLVPYEDALDAALA